MDLRNAFASCVFGVLLVQCFREGSCDQVLLSCSFERSCGLEHATDSQFYWSRISGPTPNQYTGPSVDHTFGSRLGKFVYAPSSKNVYDFGQRSTLFSPQYRLTAGRGQIEFFYHMWDGYNPNDMGTLSVYVCGSKVPLWTRRGNQGNRWRWTGKMEFSCRTTFRVYFVASRGKYQSDIALDDLVITDVSEDPTTATAEVPSTTTRVSHSTTLIHTTAVASTPTQASTTTTKIMPTEAAALSTTQSTTTSTATQTPTSTARTPGNTPTAVTESPSDARTTPKPHAASKGPAAESTTASEQSTATGASKSTNSSLETEWPTSVVDDGNTTVDGNNTNAIFEQSSTDASSSFVGPIVVMCVAGLFLGSTVCFASRWKKSPSSDDPSRQDRARYSVVNPSYVGMTDIISENPESTATSNESTSTWREGDAAPGSMDNSHGDGERVCTRRGESALYEAIPDQGGVNEYSYQYANQTGQGS